MNKMPTMVDVAHEAGVSRSAVSKVLRNAYGVSDQLREKVELAIEKTGYRPNISARGLRGATHTIGVSTPPLSENEFPSVVIDAITKTLNAHSYDVIVLPTLQQNDVEGLRRLTDRQADGIIALGTTVSTAALSGIAKTVPLVAIGRHDESPLFDSVCSDDELGSADMLSYLHGLGHTAIAFIGMPRLQYAGNHLDSNELRLTVYERWMGENGLRTYTYRASYNDIYGLLDRQLVEHPEITAVFASNDSLALAAMAVTSERHPDVSVAGFDGIPSTGYPFINLTTVDQHGDRLGAQASRLLLERVEGREEAIHLTVSPTLIIRASTFPPHRHA